MKTTLAPIDKRKNGLLKKYHVLLSKIGMSEADKVTLLSQWKVASSKDMNSDQLEQLCNLLERVQIKVDPELAELEKWRDWVRTCIKAYGRANGVNYTNEYAEGIVCSATKIENFNNVSKKRLQGIYNQFKKSKNDAKLVKEMIVEDIKAVAWLN